jgi:hypothetical protein
MQTAQRGSSGGGVGGWLKIEEGEMEREEESKDSLEEERERSGEEMMVKQE